MRSVLVALAAVLAVLMPHSASAAEDVDPRPSVAFPLSSHGSGPVEVQIEGFEGEAWGVRLFAQEADRLLPGVEVYTRGTCADRPEAVCVSVVVGEWDETGMTWLRGEPGDWYGLTSFEEPGRVVLYLNAGTRTENRYAVAVHEFGHVLGLDHHAGEGIEGASPDVLHLSPAEVRALRSAYPAR